MHPMWAVLFALACRDGKLADQQYSTVSAGWLYVCPYDWNLEIELLRLRFWLNDGRWKVS